MGWFSVLLILLGIFVVPFIISSYLSKSLRVPESGFGMGVMLSSILAAAVVIYAALQPEQPLTHTIQEGETVQSIAEQYDNLTVRSLTDENNLSGPSDVAPGKVLRIPNPKRLEIKRGVDLSGGVILVYEVDDERTAAQQGGEGDDDAAAEDRVDIEALVEALGRRINPGGVKEVVIRPYGDKQVEIIIPDVDDAEVERIKRQIVKAGFLRFLIMAKRSDHPNLFAQANSQPNVRVVRQGDEVLGEWVPVSRTEDGIDYKVQVEPSINSIREPRPGQLEVLMAYDQFSVEGKHLRSVSKGYDDVLAPAVDFSMTSQGARLFGALTATNLPDEQTGRTSRLGIIMDNELISAPSIQSKISDRGQIMGRFSDEEVEELVNVLRAGRLPAVLKPEPISENRIDPLLGEDTIRKGSFAIGASLIAVLVFMLLYYRFAGLVACFALLLNLVLILALMILISGAFSLPGLAGLVLTVGMSVDANVLIFERIREELKRGAALRMAIRNGFARATTTIVDANLTTLITAIVLYVIGTDQLRGFAVTLILGILMSMFTAIYCSRIIFDVAERRRFLKKLTMTQLLDQPNLNLIGMRKGAAVLSVILIAVGLGAVVARGRGLFDIDFLGGTSVQARLTQSMPYNEVWDRLDGIADDLSLTQVNPENADPDTVYKIDTSIPDNKVLEAKLSETFTDNGKSLLVTHSVSFEPPRAVDESASTDQMLPESDTAEDAGGGVSDGSLSAPSDATGAEADAETEPAVNDGAQQQLPPDNVLAMADEEQIRLAQLDTPNNTPSEANPTAVTTLTFDERRDTRHADRVTTGSSRLAGGFGTHDVAHRPGRSSR